MKEQTSLLEPNPRVILDDVERGCRVTYEPRFLPPAFADRLFTELSQGAPWETEAPVVFGRAIEVRRRSCAFGDPGLVYRYSGLERVAHPWSEALARLVQLLASAVSTRFNFALANLYIDGDAALGWHSDDERDLERDAPIASISLGETRDFALRLRDPSARARPAITTALEHGSLLVMAGATQRLYQHRVPPRKRAAGARVSLTFRRIVRVTPAGA